MKTNQTRSSIHWNRWWDILSVLLLLAALITLVTRLSATDWTDQLYVTEFLIIAGFVLGIGLGYSRFSSRVSVVLAFFYGVVLIPWQLGRTVKFTSVDMQWGERLTILMSRIQTVVYQIIQDEVIYDSILFILLMSVIVWCLSVFAGYTLIRKGNAWLSILPAGFTIVIIQIFDPAVTRRIWYLAAFLFFSLMLIARSYYLHNRQKWQENKTSMPPELGLDFMRFTLIAVSILVILSWSVPALASSLPAAQEFMQPLKQEWNDVQDRLDNVFASLRSSIAVPVEYYGANLSLGRGNVLSDKIVFVSKPEKPIPDGVRLYWRARAYDHYLGNQWSSPNSQKAAWNPDESSFLVLSDENRWENSFLITPYNYILTLISPAQPTWTDRIGEVEMFTNPDGTVDILSIRSLLSIRPGTTYQANADLSQAKIYDMQNAGIDYPEWVLDRYLQLPETITPRTRQLAEEITAGLETPFDKTLAITNYLRDNMTYSETVPEIQFSQEAVDWFLFDHQEGFCNYYASAEVVLLRSVGIPARLAVGYATGEELDNGRYLIRQKQAHAWPEVYFPGLGWVEFEPTASQPVIERLPGGEEDTNTANQDSNAVPLKPPTPMMEDDQILGDLDSLNNNTRQLSISPLQIGILISILLFIISVVVIIILRSRNILSIPPLPILVESSLLKLGFKPPQTIRLWAQFASLPPLITSYMEINRAIARLGEVSPVNSTPSERAIQLGFLLPPAKRYADQLVVEYEIGLFSRKPSNIEKAQLAGEEIKRLSYIAYLRKLYSRVLGVFRRKQRKPVKELNY